MGAPGTTPGPWQLRSQPHGYDIVAQGLAPDGYGGWLVELHGRHSGGDDFVPEFDANANLIAAAPDHADIGWAMCVAAGRWESWGDGRGEFCLNGLRFATKLDPFGIPEVNEPLRAQIAKARGEA